MEFKAISKKTMRAKDYASLKKGISGYRVNQVEKERVFRTPRGYFYQKDNQTPAIEISITQAQKFFNLNHINVQTGW